MNKALCGGILLATAFVSPVISADVRSISRIAFGPGDTIFVADWKEAKVHAFRLGPAARDEDKQFNVTDLDAVLRKVLGESELQIEDMAMRPGT
jgi:hypothetical protein